jgi:hypothetical protein
MPQTIQLHGGPWHGKVVTVQDGRSHFHIIQPVPPLKELPDPDELASYPTREGIYSRVHGSIRHFEWDGYTSHD